MRMGNRESIVHLATAMQKYNIIPKLCYLENTFSTSNHRKQNQAIPNFSLNDFLLPQNEITRETCILKKVFILILPRGIQI